MKSYEPSVNLSMFGSCECLQLYNHLSLCSYQCCRFTTEESAGLPAGVQGVDYVGLLHSIAVAVWSRVWKHGVLIISLCCAEFAGLSRALGCSMLLVMTWTLVERRISTGALCTSFFFFFLLSSYKNLKQNDCYTSLGIYIFIHPYTSLQNDFIPSHTGERGSTLC